jgi:hypothetical protein
MKAYKNKLKRDIIPSSVSNGKLGVYTKAVRNYQKGEEVFIGTIKDNDKQKFDILLKIIK